MSTYPMDENAKKVFDIAFDIAKKYSNMYVGTEHLLYGIMNVDCVTSQLFAANKIKKENLLSFFETEEPKISSVDPVLSENVQKMPFAAYNKALQFGASLITPDFIMMSIFDHPTCVALVTMQTHLGVDAMRLKLALYSVLSSNDYRQSVSSSSSIFGAENKYSGGGATLPAQLEELGVDVTKRARENKLDPVIGREKEVERIIEILCRKTKNNPVLIGEPGVGKSAIIDGLARAIVDGKVPSQLKNNIVFSLNIGSLMAGTKYRGQLEEKLKDAIDLIKSSGNIIVFIDELHTLMQAGQKDGEVTPADILKPYLARGELQTIGATTTDEYRKYIEADKAMERRFQPIIVEPPTVEQTIEILRGLRPNYENFHKVKLSDEAIVAAAKLSDKYIADRFLPDKAIDLIDEAMSRAKVGASTDSDDINELSDKLKEYTRLTEDCASKRDYGNAQKYQQKCDEIRKQIDSRNLQRAVEHENSAMTINADHIADVVSRWTKIPVNKLTETESDRLKSMEQILHKRVIGQNKAVEAVSKAIRRARAGLKSDNRPIGSFIFLGPTGVGKTELTKALAEAMFDNENSIIRLDMSEFMESHSVSKLIGAPPGYVGFDDGGQLTEKVRRHPYSVVLFDEIEKAHPDVFNALLQILDDGRLTDSQGRTVSFKNTIIIMTSNIGAGAAAEKREIGFNAVGRKESEVRDDAYMKALRSAFKPEFINRIDVICVFDKLTRDDVAKIADIMIKRVESTLKDKNITLNVSAEALAWLIDKGYDSEYGARPLRRVIEQNVEDKIAEAIIDGKIRDNSTVNVECDDDGIILS